MTAPWPSSTSRAHKRWDKTAGRFVFVENGSAHLPCCFSSGLHPLSTRLTFTTQRDATNTGQPDPRLCAIRSATLPMSPEVSLLPPLLVRFRLFEPPADLSCPVSYGINVPIPTQRAPVGTNNSRSLGIIQGHVCVGKKCIWVGSSTSGTIVEHYLPVPGAAESFRACPGTTLCRPDIRSPPRRMRDHTLGKRAAVTRELRMTLQFLRYTCHAPRPRRPRQGEGLPALLGAPDGEISARRFPTVWQQQRVELSSFGHVEKPLFVHVQRHPLLHLLEQPPASQPASGKQNSDPSHATMTCCGIKQPISAGHGALDRHRLPPAARDHSQDEVRPPPH